MHKLDGDIAVGTAAIETPIGTMLFTVSYTASFLAGEDARCFVAIAHHTATGVMTIGSSGEVKGAPGYRLACANAALRVWDAVQDYSKHKRMFEATRYDN
jgi:hypothetical protein